MKTLTATLLLLALAAGVAGAAPKHSRAVQRVALTVTSNGFEPADVSVRAGRPLVLTVTRTTDRTCAKEIVFAEGGIRRALPLNEAVTIRFTPKQAGSLRYACGMNMLSGTITVR